MMAENTPMLYGDKNDDEELIMYDDLNQDELEFLLHYNYYCMFREPEKMIIYLAKIDCIKSLINRSYADDR